MSAAAGPNPEGLTWQTGVWDEMSQGYLRAIEERFAPVTEAVIRRAGLQRGARVLDLGTGTGAVARRAARLVAPSGQVIGVDISLRMLALAQQQAAAAGLTNVRFQEGRAEAIPTDDASCDVLLASLSLMYAIDRATAAGECARVLRPGGRLVASCWAGPEQCDIVLFQQTAGRFAPPSPAPGVGPGALADPTPFLARLAAAGIDARLEEADADFVFDSFAAAWDVLAAVTTAGLAPERQAEAQAAVQAIMWPDPERPRQFRNVAHIIVGERTR
jgi:SAM-dependent methyltransferase